MAENESIPPERISVCPRCREAYDENDGHTCPMDTEDVFGEVKIDPDEYRRRLNRVREQGGLIE